MIIDLGKWMNNILLGWVVAPNIANMFDETIIACLMIIVAVCLDFIFRGIFVGGLKQYNKKHERHWIDLLLKRKVVKHFIRIIPGILVYMLLPLAFVKGKHLLGLFEKLCAIYITMMIAFSIVSTLLMCLDIYETRDSNKKRPMKGLIQVCEVIVYFIAAIIVISVLINKSPTTLLTGLGASAAILMLVLTDSLLSFCGVIHIPAHGMLHV